LRLFGVGGDVDLAFDQAAQRLPVGFDPKRNLAPVGGVGGFVLAATGCAVGD